MIFSKFGVIESIRILPDRECAFINFSTMEESLRAKDTLVNKMSSRLSNHHLVKVGFGKSDTTVNVMPLPVNATTTHENVQGPTRALCMSFCLFIYIFKITLFKKKKIFF